MDTQSELARNAHYETLDAGQPGCHKCHRTDRETSLVWCGARACNRSICQPCATEAEWQMEACSGECLASVARDAVAREANLRHTVYKLRKQVSRAAQASKTATPAMTPQRQVA